MSKTYIARDEVSTYVDARLWDLCTLAILDSTQYQLATNKPEHPLFWSRTPDKLAQAIEYHGLSGLVYSLAKEKKISPPSAEFIILQANAAKHSQRWGKINQALTLIKHLSNNTIQYGLLKGTALAAQVYEKPYHRAMFDIDLICSKENARLLYNQCLLEGFRTSSEEHQPKKHHHLPCLSKKIDNQDVYLEIHTDALSHDLNVQLSWDNIKHNLRTIFIDKESHLTLSHEMMLIQLCTHAFARDQVIKLSNIVDIFRYCLIYETQIDWVYLIKESPETILKMRYSRILLDLPETILTQIKGIELINKHAFSHVGEGMMPLREINNKNLSFFCRLTKLFFPSKWWQHAFYAISPNNEPSLKQRGRYTLHYYFVRYLLHPMTAVKWIATKYSHQTMR